MTQKIELVDEDHYIKWISYLDQVRRNQEYIKLAHERLKKIL